MWVFITICLVGAIVLITSLVLGEIFEHGGEFVHDVGVEHEVFDHGGEVDHAGGGPSIFSMRIISSFITGFGGAGAIASNLGIGYLLSSLLGVGAGVIMAGLVYAVASFLFSQQASSDAKMDDILGRQATISVAIPKDGMGQISLTVKGKTVFYSSKTEDGREVPYGATVTVKKIVGDVAVV